jgi:hypothetical protein
VRHSHTSRHTRGRHVNTSHHAHARHGRYVRRKSQSLINSHPLFAPRRTAPARPLVELMGTSVSDGPGFLHSTRKAHVGRGSVLPPAALRSLVVVIGRVARSEPGLARLLLKVRARVDPPGIRMGAARWRAPLGQAGDQHLRVRPKGRGGRRLLSPPPPPPTRVPKTAPHPIANPRRPGQARRGKGRSGAAACGRANTSWRCGARLRSWHGSTLG